VPNLPGASYVAPPRVVKLNGGRSYFTNDARSLADWLMGSGWRRYPPKAGNEMCRLWRSDSLILLYLSGSIVAAGRRPEVAHLDLGSLLDEPEGQQLTLWAESEVL
jgi:hypothetical protein